MILILGKLIKISFGIIDNIFLVLNIVSFSLNIKGSQIIQNPNVTISIKAILIIKLILVVVKIISSNVLNIISIERIITLEIINLKTIIAVLCKVEFRELAGFKAL
jgi:hypothetical protein